MTYQPRTQGGKEVMQDIGNLIAPVVEPLQRGAEWMGDTTLDATGSPALATAVRTGIEVAPDLVGGKILSNIPGRKLEAGDLAASGGQMGRQRGAVAGNSPNDATPAGRQDGQSDLSDNVSEFREWFGDSEIVDDSGEPLVVYHGTNSEFSEFDKSKRGSVYDDDASRSGFFFTEDLEGSKFFAQKAVDKNGGEVFIQESHLKISEPFVITDDILTQYTNRWLDDLKESDPDEWDFQVSTQAYENSENISKGLELAISDAASKPMYDGVIVDLGSDERWFIAFEPNQIKTNNTISSGQIESD
jgi:hypothetical protein